MKLIDEILFLMAEIKHKAKDDTLELEALELLVTKQQALTASLMQANSQDLQEIRKVLAFIQLEYQQLCIELQSKKCLLNSAMSNVKSLQSYI